MKKIKIYTPVIIQAIALLTGYLLINAGLAKEAEMNNAINSSALTVETEYEPAVENWMIDLAVWELEKNIAFEESNVHNEEIQIEEWMTDAGNDYWESTNQEFQQIDEEDELRVEQWMLNLSQWNN